MKEKILKSLEKLWEENPKVRFGQLLEGLKIFENNMFYQEDRETLRKIEKKIKNKDKKENKGALSDDELDKILS